MGSMSSLKITQIQTQNLKYFIWLRNSKICVFHALNDNSQKRILITFNNYWDWTWHHIKENGLSFCLIIFPSLYSIGMGSINSFKMSRILSLDSNLPLLMAKTSNQEDTLLVACIHRDNSIWKEYIQQSFGDTVNATGAWDQKLQPANSKKKKTQLR